MWEYFYKFFEYAPLYIGLVLVPAIIRTVVDAVIIKIPPSTFSLPPKQERSIMFISYEDAFSTFVGTALLFPLYEEIVFRACPYIFLGLTGLIIGNAVWILAHPSWQLRYVSGLPLNKKIGFTLSTVFYYSCCAIFFSIPWLQGFGLLSVAYHMIHNGILTLGGIFTEVELPAPWKKEESEYFRESRGLKKKLEEKFFKDTKPSEEVEEEEEELDIDIGRKFFREIREIEKPVEVRRQEVAKRVAVMKIDDDWLFWRL
ncbi:MAG TPA: hypothetical protein ENG66_06570 [Thermococcus sp.]|nr:MAG: hypothetical protein DRP04_03400 [Archaeoglobales archaeon]HDH45034.1 hypothetical protein [Thermococcus sp.]